MIQKVVKKRRLKEQGSVREELAHWLGRKPEERIAAVEYLRRQYYEIQPDFRELLALFSVRKVEYVIASAYAVGAVLAG